jgi:hypothetical protein
MAQALHQCVDQHESSYNPVGVHRSLLGYHLGLATAIVPSLLMGVNEQSRYQ